ncbi:hypothetical protein ACTHGU_18450 [Chitinophagaceae bacterium MMS25-I14]
MYWIFRIIAILLSLAAGYWVYRADKRRNIPKPWLTAALRSLVILGTLLLLVFPVLHLERHKVQKPVVVLLQDNSVSAGVALKGDSVKFRQAMLQLGKHLSDDYQVVYKGFGDKLQDDSLFRYDQQSTDISSALNEVQEIYGRQNLGGIVLATDGRFNQGSNPLYAPSAFNGSLYTVALGDSQQHKDIRIAQVYANRVVSLKSQFEVRADILALRCNGYSNTVKLEEAGKGIVATAALSVSSDRYDRSVSFTVQAETPGLHHYIITIPAADGEENTANNKRDVFVEVTDEKKHILILAAAPHPDVTALKEALAGMEQYEVTVRGADNIPSSLAGYQTVILHGLPDNNANLVQLLENSHKPVWCILGPQSNFGAINLLQKAVVLHMTSGYQQDLQPSANTSFDGFTLPQGIAATADKMPPLSVPAGSVAPAPGTSALFVQRGTAAPLWVLHSGSPSFALLAGEGIWRWRLYEYKNSGTHNVIDECIRQTVALLTANSNEKPFRVELPKYIWSEQEPVNITAYLLNASNEQVNSAPAQLTLTDSAGHKQEYSFERSGNAYRLNIGIHSGGNYTYTAHTVYDGKTYNVSGSFVIEHMPLELMETGADFPLLYGLSKKYNGSLFTTGNIATLYDSIKLNKRLAPVIRTETDTLPLVDNKWFFAVLLLIAIAEWLLRKYWLAQ